MVVVTIISFLGITIAALVILIGCIITIDFHHTKTDIAEVMAIATMAIGTMGMEIAIVMTTEEVIVVVEVIVHTDQDRI